MGTINHYFIEITKRTRFRFSKQGKELNKILSIPRYQQGITKIFGFDFRFVDSASFVGQFNEIFRNQIYKFTCKKNNPFIIDCGANIGTGILFFKKIYPEAEVLAFEPDKDIFKVLEQNIKNANLSGVIILNKAVWENDGRKEFYQDGADSGYIIEERDGFKKVIEIDTFRLKNVLVRPIDFLKIDIEGAEYTVVKDCDENLKNVSNIFIEYHSIENTNQNLEK